MTRNLAVLGLAERRDPTTRTLDPDVWLRRCAALWALGRTVDAFDIALIGFAVGVWFASGWLSLLGLMALAVVWWRRRRALGERAVSPLYRPIGVLVALAILAVLPSADLEVSLTRLLGLGLGVVLYLRMFDLLDNEKRLWILVSGLAMVGVLVALVGLVGTDWRLDGAPALRAVKEHLPRLITFLPRSEAGGLNPNKLAAALAMLLPLPTAVMLFTPGRFLRLGWGTGAALIGIALVLTESASGLLAGAGALTALAGMRSRMAQRVLPLLGIVVLGVVWWIGPGSIAEAWLGLSLAPEEPPSLDARFKVWSVALSLISSGPLLGIGIGTFPEAVAEHAGWLVANGQPEIPHAHNLYMQVALDIGLPGLVVFLALMAGALRLTRYAVRMGPTARAQGVAAGVASGLLAYLVYGLTDAIGLGEKPGLVLWLLLGLISAGGAMALREPGRAGQRAWRGAGVDAPSIGSVIYLSSFEWTYHTARPQQLARALANHVPVLYVETTGLRGAGRGDLTRLLRRLRRGIAGRYRAGANVWVFSPLAVPLSGPDAVRKLNRMILRDSILGQVRDLGLVKPLLLTSLPTAASLDLVGHLGEVASVYDCMDDLTAVPLVDPSIGRTEAELANRVDVVVTASEELRRLKAGLGQHVVVIGQGVDPAHFAAQTICPPELSRLPRPWLLFVGGVDDRLDFELIKAVARRRPDWSILLLGPELYVRAAQHVHAPNVHRLGRRSFSDLPAYVQAADVCLVPYRDTAWARACNPVKVLEYLAAGRPIVSTDVPAVRAYEPFVRIACDPDTFAAAVEAALHEDDPAHQEARRARARGDTWAMRADALFGLGSAVARERSAVEQPR